MRQNGGRADQRRLPDDGKRTRRATVEPPDVGLSGEIDHLVTPARGDNRRVRPRSDKLDVINALVHDEYFALDRLAHDLASRELRLPVFRGRWTKALVGWRGRGPGDPPGDPFATLVIGGARAFHVNDSADVGWYDIERVDL